MGDFMDFGYFRGSLAGGEMNLEVGKVYLGSTGAYYLVTPSASIGENRSLGLLNVHRNHTPSSEFPLTSLAWRWQTDFYFDSQRGISQMPVTFIDNFNELGVNFTGDVLVRQIDLEPPLRIRTLMNLLGI